MAFCHADTAALVSLPKYPVAPAGIEYLSEMSACWRHVTSAPFDPIVRSLAKEQDEEVVVGAEPVRAASTFAIVALSAPKAVRSARIDWICAVVSPEACVVAAGEEVVVVGSVVEETEMVG